MGPLRFDDIGEKLSFFISNLDETATKKKTIKMKLIFVGKKKDQKLHSRHVLQRLMIIHSQPVKITRFDRIPFIYTPSITS
jgi:hypothetical protein